MALISFPNRLGAYVLDDADPFVGKFTTSTAFDLKYIGVLHFVKGVGDGSFRLSISQGREESSPFAYSETRTIASWRVGNNTLSYVLYKFDKEGIYTSDTYFVKMERITYTRNADTFYVAFIKDAPLEVNTPLSTVNKLNAAGVMQIFGNE